MDIDGFLLASGFALLVILLGWTSQITSKSKETKEIENKFLEKAKIKRPDFKKIISKSNYTVDSLSKLIDFLFSEKKDKEEDIKIYQKIEIIYDDLIILDKRYNSRFWILFFMSISFFISGIICLFLCSTYKLITLVPNLVFVIVIFYNLTKVYNLEKRYVKNISEIMEEL